MGIGRPRATSTTGSMTGDVVTQTTAPITLYVRANGDDSNDGLTENTALATIQEAVDRVPKFVQHDVTIDVGEGNFDGFWVRGFVIPSGVVFTVQGTLGAPTLSSGTTSGTATGGDTTTLIDTNQNWTTNELRGRFLLVDGEYRVIRENTSNTIYVVGEYSSSVSAKGYSILEGKTIINQDCPYTGLSIRVLSTANKNTRDSLVFRDLTTTGGTIGFAMWNTSAHTFERLHSTGGVYGIVLQTTQGTVIIRDCYSQGSTYCFTGVELTGQLRMYSAYAYGATNGWGFYVGGTVSVANVQGYIFADNNKYGATFFTVAEFIPKKFSAKNNSDLGVLFADVDTANISLVDIQNNGGHGIKMLNTRLVIYSADNANTISNNGKYGILIDDEIAETLSGYKSAGSFLRVNGKVNISNNSLGGIFAGVQSVVESGNTTGTGNGNYGITLAPGAQAIINSQTSVTGSSGDITLDGTTALSYATDFANNGDIVSNLSKGNIIRRED